MICIMVLQLHIKKTDINSKYGKRSLKIIEEIVQKIFKAYKFKLFSSVFLKIFSYDHRHYHVQFSQPFLIMLQAHFNVLVFLFCPFLSVVGNAGPNCASFLPYVIPPSHVGASFWYFRISTVTQRVFFSCFSAH